MKVYQFTFSDWLGYIITAIFIAGLSTLMLVSAFQTGDELSVSIGEALLLLVVFTTWFIALLWVAYRVTITEEGAIEFRSLFYSKTVAASQIFEIVRPRFYSRVPQCIDIRYTGGMVRCYDDMAGLDTFLRDLKRDYPSIRERKALFT